MLFSCYGRNNKIYSFKIKHTSDLIKGKLFIDSLLKSNNYSKVDIEKIKIAYVELGNNIINHARTSGEIIIKALESNSTFYGIEIIAIDSGIGMSNYRNNLKDNFSSNKTLGIGLGAVKRFSTYFDIYSEKNLGTIILFQYLKKQLNNNKISYGGLCLPLNKNKYCGDHWSLKFENKNIFLLLSDGLGHGLEASKASDLALDIFSNNSFDNTEKYLNAINLELYKTRGAAVAIVQLDLYNDLIYYTGLGNIKGKILRNNKHIKNIITKKGIAGGFNRSYLIKKYEFPKDSILILNSDGIKTSYDLTKYRGLFSKHPSIISALIFRDFKRDNDDVSVFILKRT